MKALLLGSLGGAHLPRCERLPIEYCRPKGRPRAIHDLSLRPAICILGGDLGLGLRVRKGKDDGPRSAVDLNQSLDHLWRPTARETATHQR